MAARRTRTTITVSKSRGVFMISVAAELAEMHPQTLRMYETRGLITPERSPKGTRLYSQRDVDRLRRIQEMTADLGMNLAGVERVFELEDQLERMGKQVEALERRAERIREEMESELERVRRSFRAEIVPYSKPGSALIPSRDVERFRIAVERRRRGGDPPGCARPAAARRRAQFAGRRPACASLPGRVVRVATSVCLGMGSMY